MNLVVARLLDGLERADLAGRLWIVEPSRIRQYDEDESADDDID